VAASPDATLRDDELRITREFDAPVALVFRLWENPDHMIRWWGPEKFTATQLDWEAKAGKPWRATMVSKQYGVIRMGGVVREVVKNQRLVFTFAWDEDSGRDMETLVTVTFEEKDGKTLQTFHQTPFSSVAQRDSHVGGWQSLFNKQQEYAENFALAERKD
jgi:uncharacterized protein YndB with AHSA1/START domain